METVVLQAQDHLAQERYRQQARVRSGTIYPLDVLPRTNRKVKAPRVFTAASLHAENAKVSSNQITRAVDSRSALSTPLEMTLGVLRDTPTSASTPPIPPMSELKTSQYRLRNKPPYGFSSRDSPLWNQQLESSLPRPVLNEAPATPSIRILRSRADVLVEGEKISERRTSQEKSSESTKSLVDRKPAEETLVEKMFDRKKVLERKIVEKKAPAISSGQAAKTTINAQKKAGVMTILQRPQTKEAAAINLALFTGRPIDVVFTQTLDSSKAPHERQDQAVVKEMKASVGSSTESHVRDDISKGQKEKDVDRAHPGNVSIAQQKKVGKKKPSSDFHEKISSQVPQPLLDDSSVKVISHANLEAPENFGLLRLDDMAKASKVLKEEKIESLSPGTVRSTPQKKAGKKKLSRDSPEKSVSRLAYETMEWYLKGLMDGNSVPDSVREPQEYDMRRSAERIKESSPASPMSVGRINVNVRNLGSRGAVSSPNGGLRRGASDSFLGDDSHVLSDEGHVALARSGSLDDLPSGTDSSVEIVLLPSSPPKSCERWAGPGYTNSPPPSTLPFPTFPFQRTKSLLTGVSLGQNAKTVSEYSSAPSSPTRVSSFFFTAVNMQSPSIDPSSATKDLRRMLNLDAERDFESVHSILKTTDMFRDSATQSLKRILQLS